MKRLIVPVGRSRLNLLAALDRVKPQKLLAITTEENHSLTVSSIKDASGLDDLEVDIRTLSKAFDIELVSNEMKQISDEFPPTEFDYTLISGSTNQICYMCYMQWPGIVISIKNGLVSSIENIDIQHSINESDFLSLYQLIVIDGKLCENNNTQHELFPDSSGFEVDNKKGSIKIFWDIDMDDDYHKKTNIIRDQSAKKAESLGQKTFHHQVRCIRPFKLHKEIEDLVTFEIVGEEE
tara:strand:+ start:522 stop:1232 length:711 start_codon:yes stop_codon:yes gene_type:complete